MKHPAFIVLWLLCAELHASVSLPAVLSDHMVLKQNSTVKFWGWCNPMEPIAVTADWDQHTHHTTGTKEATWELLLQTPAAGGPYTIRIAAENQIVLTDVMVGEVWICGGQSNMEYSAKHGVKEAAEAAKNATNNQIRFFFADKATSSFPQDKMSGTWRVCSPEDMMKFSAIGYFFGEELHQALKVPVGLMNINWSGTPAEVWLPANLVLEDSLLNANKTKVWTSAEWWPDAPGLCYNAMIHPLANFDISGVIWYQGESNTEAPISYEQLFSKLIQSWRALWHQVLPFYFVQIAPCSKYSGTYSAALLRESQARVQQLEATAMVVIHDLIDDIDEIHPQRKKEVGLRLANLALADHYHFPVKAFRSPEFDTLMVNGSEAHIALKHLDCDLTTIDGLAPNCFLVAGDDKKFVTANTRIEKHKVIATHPQKLNIKAIRFGFNNTDRPNLITTNGLPVATFRTDNWFVDR